jgi:hypothetical protein
MLNGAKALDPLNDFSPNKRAWTLGFLLAPGAIPGQDTAIDKQHEVDANSGAMARIAWKRSRYSASRRAAGRTQDEFFSRLKRDINIEICYLNRLRNTP